MSNSCTVECRKCKEVLFTFAQLVIHESREKVIIRPAISRLATVSRRPSPENSSDYSLNVLVCRECYAVVANCDSDAIVQTSCDILKVKALTFVNKDERLEEEKCKDIIQRLRVWGLESITQNEFLKQAGAKFLSREGCQSYPTDMVDTRQLDQSTVERLTKTPMRNYQIEMAEYALSTNSLVCLPTGSGKTLVATAVMRAMLHINQKKVAVFVVPTNHLVEQQSVQVEKELSSYSITTIFGQMDPDLRARNMKILSKFKFDILVCTCECLNRLIEINTLRVEDMCCLVLDEAHETKKNSPYARLIRAVHCPDVERKKRPLVLGMTASPIENINKETDPAMLERKIIDLQEELGCFPCYPCKNDPYENGINHTDDIAYHVPSGTNEVELAKELDAYIVRIVGIVKNRPKVIEPVFDDLASFCQQQHGSVLDTNKFRGKLRTVEKRLDTVRNESDDQKEQRRVLYGYAVRSHLLQILAVHEINSVIGAAAAKDKLKLMFDSIESAEMGYLLSKKQVLYLFSNDFSGKPVYDEFYQKLKRESSADASCIHHLSNRYQEIMAMIKDHFENFKDEARMLVFVEMRRTAKQLCEFMSRDELVRTMLNPRVIVGRGLQGDGLNVEEQQEILRDFRRGSTRLLVSTTVLEEGLDVPSCNLVLRTTPPDTLRRFIQSRGRACRSERGRFRIICKDKDEAEKQRDFLHCMQKQAQIIKDLMRTRAKSDLAQTENQTVALDLEKDYGREACGADSSDTGIEDDDIDDETLQEMIKIMAHEGESLEQVELNPYDEDDSTEASLFVRFVIFAKDDIEYQQVNDQLDSAFEVLEVDFKSELRNFYLQIKNRFGTKYCPETKLKKQYDDPDDGRFFEKTVLEYFMSPQMAGIPVWLSMKPQRSYFPRSSEIRRSFRRCHLGSLKSHDSFIARKRLGETGSIYFDRGSNTVRIVVEDDLRIEGSFDDLQDFALIHNTVDGNSGDAVTHLYLTFVQPPRLATMKETSDREGKVHPSQLRITYYKDLESRRIFANCLTYKLEMSNPVTASDSTALVSSHLQILRLLESCGVSVYYTNIRTVKPEVSLPEQDSAIDPVLCPKHAENSNVNYAMKCLMTATGFVPDRVTPEFYAFLGRLDESDATSVLYRLATFVNRYLFYDLLEQAKIEANAQPIHTESLGDDSHAFIKRAILTPTSILFFEPDYSQTNRIIRQYSHVDFIRVSIRDENMEEQLSGLHGELDRILDRLKTILLDGFKIAGTTYRFLAASNSQLRMHSCYFAADKDGSLVDSIRKGVGDLAQIRNVATYAARLGLGFSTSENTLKDAIYQKETDVKNGKYIFSDGIGLIPKSLAEQVRLHLKRNKIPSAFQIRLGGCKGMISVWDDTKYFKQKGRRELIVVRESMFKYQSDDKGLEVLDYTRPLPLHLNQQLIMLLSYLGVPDDTFMALLNGEISGMAEMFVDEKAACTALETIVSDVVKPLRDTRFSIIADPYFRQLMIALYKSVYYRSHHQEGLIHAVYRVKMKDLRERSRVRIDDDKGRVLIGILDETGILEYGQVYIQISKHFNNPGIDPRVITGDIVIMKNPCLHPGDARTFKGVDIPELSHCVDCVVFPSKGPRPHPNELSGSDLDGDQYHCIWDRRLLPTLELHAPMEYDGASAKQHDGEITVKDIVDHMCDYIGNDTLGVIDNTHKALADQKGLSDEYCIKLANIHAIAVDARKTSRWEKVPPEIKSQVRVYPDFMMKSDKPSYPSSKILGQMFRECMKFSVDASSSSTAIDQATIRADQTLNVEGHANYMDEAVETYKNYNQELLAMMHMYGIKTESELVSGQIAQVSRRHRHELDDIQRNVTLMLKKITSSYRAIFKKNLRSGPGSQEAEEEKEASAWYLVAYSNRHGETYSVGKEQHRFLSFPWIVSDILGRIYQRKANSGGNFGCRSLESEISDSIMETAAEQVNELRRIYETHQLLCDAVKDSIDDIADSFLFGLSSLLLFDKETSDASILVIRRRNFRRNMTHKDRTVTLSKIKSDARGFDRAFLDKDVPRLRVRISEKLPLRRACLTADVDSMVRWIVLKKYIFKNRWIFPVLRVVCSWVVNTGLVAGNVFFLPEYFVPLLFIDHCLKEREVKSVNCEEARNDYERFLANPYQESPFGTDREWEDLLNSIPKRNGNERCEQRQTGRTGRLLCSFMKKGKEQLNSTISQHLQPIFGGSRKWSDVEKKERLDLLSTEMITASHRLSLHVSASVLQIKVTVERLFFIKYIAAKILAGDEHGLQRMLHQKSGANVDVQNKMDTIKPGMIVKGTGTEVELYMLDGLIRLLNHRAKTESESRRAVRVQGLKDVIGAHNLLVEGSTVDSGLICLEPYMGFRYPHHDGRSLYVIRLAAKSVQSSTDTRDTDVFVDFRRHFKHQLNYFNRNYSKEIYGQIELQVKFGRSYVVSPPQSFVEDQTGLTADCLLKALERRKHRAIDPIFQSTNCRRSTGGRGAPTNAGNAISTSFFASVRLGDSDATIIKTFMQELVKDLVQSGEDSVKYTETDRGIKITANTGSDVYTARYDSDLTFKGMDSAPIRWIVSDVKRISKIQGDVQDGSESDVRFILKTQTEETVAVEEETDPALYADFKDAIGEEQIGKSEKVFYIKKPHLDVQYLEDYIVHHYELPKSLTCLIDSLTIRESRQHTRLVKNGRFSRKESIKEVRMIPKIEPFLDSCSVDAAIETLWVEALGLSDRLTFKTR